MNSAALRAYPLADSEVLYLRVLESALSAGLAGREEPVHLDERVAFVPEHVLEGPPAAAAEAGVAAVDSHRRADGPRDVDAGLPAHGDALAEHSVNVLLRSHRGAS